MKPILYYSCRKISLLLPVVVLAGIFSVSNLSAQTLKLKFGFEDTGTTTADSVAGTSLNMVDANGAAVDLHGATGTGVAGLGKALDLTSASANSSGPIVSTVNNSGLGFGTVNSWTVTEWVKPNGSQPNLARFFIIGANGTVEVNGTGSENSFAFAAKNTKISCQVYINGSEKGSVEQNLIPPLPVGGWTFIAYVYDGNTLSLYSGSDTNSVTFLGSASYPGLAINFGGAGSLFLGNRNANGRAFKGYIDDVRFYTGAGDAAFLENVRESALALAVGTTSFSPASQVTDGTMVTLSAVVTGGTQPYTYDWQVSTDGGTTFQDLPTGNGNPTYIVDTTGQAGTAYQYQLKVTDSASVTVTGAAATLTVASGSLPPSVATDTAITPSTVALGGNTTMSATFNGTAPLYYQWQYAYDASGTGLTSISGATNNTYAITNVQLADAGFYRLTASNTAAGGTIANSTWANLSVTEPVTVYDFGTADPMPGPYDIAQLSTSGNTTAPDGLAAYADADSPASGQTFTTLSNPAGYKLRELYYRMTLNGHAASRTYNVRIYSVSGSIATLLTSYVNSSTTPTIAGNSDWIRITGLTNILNPNSTYAYSISFSGAGGQPLANATENYSGGQICKIPTAGGIITFGSSGAYDATFMLHLIPAGYPDISSVNISPASSSTSPVYAGTPVTLAVQASSSSPLSYHWQTDNGIGNWMDLPDANASAYAFDTTSLAAGTYQYQAIVANSTGISTSSIVTLYLLGASSPAITADTTITPSSVLVGGNTIMSATFAGTPPISYQWMFDNGNGATAIPGATNATFTLANAQLTNNGSFFVRASNGIAPYSAASSPASLLVANPAQNNNTSAIVADAGNFPPEVGADDIAQLTSQLPTQIPAGINYYVDAPSPPGQTFTTGNNPPITAGYPLTSIYVQEELSTASGGIESTPHTYTLGIYQVFGSNSVLITSYTTANTLTFNEGDWIQFSGLTNILQTNATYAFSVHRNGSGYWKLANTQNYSDPNNPANDLYPNGQIVALPASGIGAVTFSSDPTIDAAFLVRLTPASAPNLLQDTAITPVVSVAGSNVTMSAFFDGAAPIHYQWQFTDTNGIGPVAISGATNTTYTIAGTHLADSGSYYLLAWNDFGTNASTSMTLTVLPMFLAQDTTITPSAIHNGQGPVVISAAVNGTGPIYYQWLHDSTIIPGATNNVYTIPTADYADAGNYSLMASNNPDGIPSTLSSTPVYLDVQTPPTSYTANFVFQNSGTLYGGNGVLGTGTVWNRISETGSSTTVNGITAKLGISASGLGDDGSDQHIGFSIYDSNNSHNDTTGSSIFAGYMENRSITDLPLTFTNLIPGVYNVVFYGTFSPGDSQIYRATTFSLYDQAGAGFTNSLSCSNNVNSTTFSEGVNFVRFYGITVSNGVLNGAWRAINTSTPRAYFNGAQIQMAYSFDNPQIFIAAQPANQAVVVGNPAAFSVTAQGPGKLFYQWRNNGVPIAGATNNIYAADTSVIGTWNYDVVITNSTGLSATSATATLTIRNAANLAWRGYVANWDVSSPNWFNLDTSADSSIFAQGDNVLFDDSAFNFAPNLSITLTPASVTVNNDSQNYDFTGAGNLSGNMSLTKTGAGTLTLETANTYTGATIISNGVLQVGNNNALGAIGSGPVTNNGSLVFKRTDTVTVSNTISGTGVLDMFGSGTLVLATANPFSGGTALTNGQINASVNGALGSGSIVLSDAVKRIHLNSGVTLTNAILLSPGAGSGNTGRGMIEGPGTSGFAYVTGPINILPGPNANGGPAAGGHFDGGNNVNGLVVSGPITMAGNTNYVYHRANRLTILGGSISSYAGFRNQANLVLGENNGVAPGAVLFSDGGTFDLNGFSQTLSDYFGSGSVINSGAGSVTLTVTAGATNTYSGTIRDNGVNKINFVLTGGKVILSGANTYTGNTAVNGGTLEIAQAYLTANSTVKVANGAVLQLDFATTNTVAGLVLNGVSQAPGIYNAATASPYIIGTGSLRVAASGPSSPAPIASSLNGNTLNLSWPAGQGWRLQMQTNSLSAGLGDNWIYLTDGSVAGTNITINPNMPAVFYRLAYP